jgi:DNA-binding LacI/PurR family transcriptional regulator
MGKAKKTVQQIADIAGVSVATISRVMNHKNNVKEETRQKILEILRELNINPSVVLQTDQTSKTILLCVADSRNPFSGMIINGIQQSARRNQYRVFILESKEVYFTFDDFKDVLQNHSFAGIILLASVVSSELLESLSRSCPVVMCSEYSDIKNISLVSVDDITAARRATEFLVNCGCKKIGMLNSQLRHQYARRREQGYSEALEKAGLKKNEDWIVHISMVDYSIALPYAVNLLSLPDRPDAFFAISDVFAVAMLYATKRIGLRVPEDISIIGFDNIPVSSMTDPPITTIAQPGTQIGYQSCELLVEKINNPSTPRKRIMLDTELIIRGSTLYPQTAPEKEAAS